MKRDASTGTWRFRKPPSWRVTNAHTADGSEAEMISVWQWDGDARLPRRGWRASNPQLPTTNRTAHTNTWYPITFNKNHWCAVNLVIVWAKPDILYSTGLLGAWCAYIHRSAEVPAQLYCGVWQCKHLQYLHQERFYAPRNRSIFGSLAALTVTPTGHYLILRRSATINVIKVQESWYGETTHVLVVCSSQPTTKISINHISGSFLI